MRNISANLLGINVDSDRQLLQRLSLVFGLLILLALFLIGYFVWQGIKTLDQIDNQNDVEVVESLLQDRKNSMTSMLRDYAEWTDAYRNLYEKEDEKFASENIAYNLTNNYNIKVSAVVRFDKSIFVHYVDGKRSSAEKLHPASERLVDLLLADFKANRGKPDQNWQIGFTEIDNQLFMIAANFIAPLDKKTGHVLPLTNNPSMMIFERKLDNQALREWADIYKIQDIDYDPKDEDPNAEFFAKLGRFFLPIKDIDGNPLGAVDWQPNLSSHLIVHQLAPRLLGIFLVLAILGGVFVFYIRRAFANQYEVSRKIGSSRQFLQMVFDADPTLIQVRDKEGKIFFCNHAAAAHYGMTPDQLTGQSILHLDVIKDHGRMIYEDDLRTIVGNREMQGEEVWHDAQGREAIYFTLRKPIAGVSGETMVLCVSSDITAQKQAMVNLESARIKAENASRAKSEFLATISHEIRTPMNGILGFSQLLSDTELSAEQQEFIKIIENSSRALLGIINDILDMSKIEAGYMKLDSAVFNPLEVVDCAVDMVMPQAREKNIRIVKEMPSEAKYVIGDRARMQQIILNLVSNAVKFTDKGSVTIKVQQQMFDKKKTQLKFEVIDTGIGIEAKAVGQLFQKFAQADSSISRKFGGTGLGLSIAKELCEMMGGKIGVHSQLGQGSHFWFTVKLNNAA